MEVTARLANNGWWSEVLLIQGSHKAVLHQIVSKLESSAAKVITLKLGNRASNQRHTTAERWPNVTEVTGCLNNFTGSQLDFGQFAQCYAALQSA